MIDIKELGVVFPDGTVGLENINLSVDQGEFIALVGPSGSGKTTLLRTIAGFVQPSSGSLSLGGKDVTGTAPENRQIGMVFQQHAVWPHMSVFKNVEYPLARRKVAKAERKQLVTDVLKTVGLAGFENRKPDSLSGGQRQRVALARAIVANPQVVLLDEALSALDEPLRDNLRRELVALSRHEHLTTIHVTHDRKEALAIADRIVVLVDGHIQHIATPHELINRPASPTVATFMNDATLLDAHIDSTGTITCTDLGVSWQPGEYVPMDDNLAGEVTVAALPKNTHVVDTDSGFHAKVLSSLYESDAFSITAKASTTDKALSFRATVPDRPNIGDNVTLAISEPLVYSRNR